VDQHRIEETQLVTRKSARDQIHLAWNYQCAYCGDELNRSPTLDHVVPKALGGVHHRSNLVSCCFMCNSQKGHKHWVDWYRATAVLVINPRVGDRAVATGQLLAPHHLIGIQQRLP
jgi:5-methylcytosine-specific restriction endonuclease McrA